MVAKAYARIDLAAFKKLVAGEAVDIPGYSKDKDCIVSLILEDIGWGEMLAIVRAAMERAVNQPELVDDPEVRAMAYRIKATQTEPIEDEPCIIPPGDPLRV
jgi:hypothetical protein